jgi:SAM-dependent methyltransferase
VWVCESCWLVQLQQYQDVREIFDDYGYFSSYSDTWLDHCRRNAETEIRRLELGPDSLVVEVASNDGYFLRWFRDAGVPVVGVEPAANVAEVAMAAGIPTRVEYFGVASAERMVAEGLRADLLAGKNVMAQVPDLGDFVAGLRILLAPRGVVTIEFPHVVELIEGNQFDTIYHEHFSYFSVTSTTGLFGRHGLRVFDVERLSTHGGSLRIRACHADDPRSDEPGVAEMLERERAGGYTSPAAYEAFDDAVRSTKRALLRTLIDLKEQGLRIAAYGAAGKGMTLLNYCGIRTDLVDFVADRNPYKHGRACPGVHIPVRPAEAIAAERPDVVLILPWNLRDEISEQLSFVRDWGGRFLVAIPRAELF